MDRNQLRIRIGAILTGIGAFIYAFHVVKFLSIYHRGIAATFLDWGNIALLSVVLLSGLTIMLSGRVSELFQILAIFTAAEIAILDGYESFYGIGMYIVAVILVYKYGFLDRYRKIKIASLAVIYIATVEVSAQIKDPGKAAMGFDGILFVMVYLLILWFVFEDQIRRLMTEKSTLEERITRDRPYTEIGESMGGLIHNLKNDVTSISQGLQMLEKGYIDDVKLIREAAARLYSRVYNTTALLRSRHTEGETRHDGKEIANGIREIFLADRQNVATAEIEIDIPGALPLYGNGEELFQVLENIVKNSFEAIRSSGRYGKVSIRGYEDTDHSCLLISNNGGPMSACSHCSTLECMSCPKIGEGKTTKADGSGIGLSYVRRVLRRLGGDMTIYSGADGIETVLRFPKHVEARVA
jgi:signal transduction histidine kinase